MVEVNDSPQKASHLYHPHIYRETLQANEELLNKYSEAPSRDPLGLGEHRTVTTALLKEPAPGTATLHQSAATSANPGGYDLM